MIDQAGVVAGAEHRQPRHDLHERRDAEDHGQPEAAERRDGDAVAVGRRTSAAAASISGSAPHVERALEHDAAGWASASAGPRSRAGRAR